MVVMAITVFLVVSVAPNCGHALKAIHVDVPGSEGKIASVSPSIEDLRNREEKVERLAMIERDMLTEQAKALEFLAARESALVSKQKVLESEENVVDNRAAPSDRNHAVAPVRQVNNIFGDLQGVGQITALVVVTFNSILDWYKQLTLGQQLFCSMFYISSMLIFGLLYTYLESLKPREMRNPSGKSMPSTFRHGLCHGVLHPCDPDYRTCLRICFFSCFCAPVRWAATASERIMVPIMMPYYPTLIIFAFLPTMAIMSYGASLIILVVLLVLNRQRIRISGQYLTTSLTLLEDISVWIFCAPCATMQEALEVELLTCVIHQGRDSLGFEPYSGFGHLTPKDSLSGLSGEGPRTWQGSQTNFNPEPRHLPEVIQNTGRRSN